MTTIREDDFSVALINTFYVKPEKADELVQILTKATDEVMRHQPGFISANLHISFDKTRVVNYAQWRSKEDFERMLNLRKVLIRCFIPSRALMIVPPKLNSGSGIPSQARCRSGPLWQILKRTESRIRPLSTIGLNRRQSLLFLIQQFQNGGIHEIADLRAARDAFCLLQLTAGTAVGKACGAQAFWARDHDIVRVFSGNPQWGLFMLA
jgi:quinol monooxygenase YgiN